MRIEKPAKTAGGRHGIGMRPNRSGKADGDRRRDPIGGNREPLGRRREGGRRRVVQRVRCGRGGSLERDEGRSVRSRRGCKNRSRGGCGNRFARSILQARRRTRDLEKQQKKDDQRADAGERMPQEPIISAVRTGVNDAQTQIERRRPFETKGAILDQIVSRWFGIVAQRRRDFGVFGFHNAIITGDVGRCKRESAPARNWRRRNADSTRKRQFMERNEAMGATESVARPRRRPIQTGAYFSRALGRDQPFAYLTPEEDSSGSYGEERFPLIVALHGYDGAFRDWVSYSRIARYAARYRVVVVFPEGGNGWYTNAVKIGRASCRERV